MTNPRAVADRADDDIEDVEELPDLPPMEDDLPYSDGMPLESERHVIQMNLLLETAKFYFEDRPDVYVGANMFIYYNLEQVTTREFRAPDLFVVTGTTKREHKSWVVWQEGRGPNVVIELLSDSTRRTDMVIKKEIYATRLRVPEYFWFHPFTKERAGFVLHGGRYEPIEPAEHGGLPSRELDLTLVQWPGVFEGIETEWLRWALPNGTLLPTRAEVEHQRAEAERERADAERGRAHAERERAEQAEQELTAERRRIVELEARLAQYEQRAGQDTDAGA